jgi:hypothetical protein
MGGVSYCGANPGRDQRFSMEAPPNFQLDGGQTPGDPRACSTLRFSVDNSEQP